MSGSGEGKQILVVEDDSVVRDVIVELLSSEGYEILKADGIKSALKLIFETSLDLILCDLTLSGRMDGGLVVLDRVRKDNRVSNIPLVIISGRSDFQDMRTAMRAGADDYITKPFTKEELLGTVVGFLEKPRGTPTKPLKKARLTIYSPNTMPQDFELKDYCQIGRSNKCDVQFPHISISRRHALIQRDEVKNDDSYHITDGDASSSTIEPSNGGTYIKRRNDEPIHVGTRYPLMSGDRILFSKETWHLYWIDYLVEGEMQSEGTLT